MRFLSSLEQKRANDGHTLPKILEKLTSCRIDQRLPLAVDPEIEKEFQDFSDSFKYTFKEEKERALQLKVGVLLSGGQAAGGHNVIASLYDALKKFHKDSSLIGFLNGPSGLMNNRHKLLTDEIIAPYRNQGGFDMIGSGRDKIETAEQIEGAISVILDHKLDGLVIIGGDDSNTNAFILAHELKKRGHDHISVVGVPKTIDGDLKSDEIEISFGFDTATKTYASLIGSLLIDALSAKKYTFFIRLMGRSASHIALECALKTRANYVLIREEIEERKQTFKDVVEDLCALIKERASLGKHWGGVLIPEGAIEAFSDFKKLISEINEKKGVEKLSTESQALFTSLPSFMQEQLTLERDPHGNVQVAKIETERLLMEQVALQLAKEKNPPPFHPVPLFFGYEGRSTLPSLFDAGYTYALGHVAALLIAEGVTGHMALVQNLCDTQENWRPASISLISLLQYETRKGKKKPVIKKALVDLEKAPFLKLQSLRRAWRVEDHYSYASPIQFYGDEEITQEKPITLLLERG